MVAEIINYYFESDGSLIYKSLYRQLDFSLEVPDSDLYIVRFKS